MTGWIAISLGDVTGIGPEVTLKALAAEAGTDDTKYLIVGDSGVLARANEKFGTKIPLKRYSDAPDGKFFVHDPLPEPLPKNLAAGSPAAARAAIAWLTDAAQRCLKHEIDGLVTAPLSKEAVLRSGMPFIGQTEYLSALAGTEKTAMMLLGDDGNGKWLRVTLATTHVPIKLLATQLRADKIDLAIQLAHEACADLQLSRCRIGVCGLNPHAGEGGELGREEIDIIEPVVKAARARGINVAGPFAADTLFHYAYRGDYEVVIAMYHDQGLAPLKMVAFDNGVNWTLGLPFIRTSPDHGTAYDIAGHGVANPSSMRSAIALAKRLAANRGRR